MRTLIKGVGGLGTRNSRNLPQLTLGARADLTLGDQADVEGGAFGGFRSISQRGEIS